MRTLNINFEEEEMEYINKLAEKYSLTLKELGVLIGSKQNEKEKSSHLLLRVSEEENKILTTAAKQMGMSYSAFCVYAFNWFVDSGEIYQKDYLATSANTRGGEKRDKRILVYFKKSTNDKIKLDEYVSRFAVDASLLLRISMKAFVEINGAEYGIHL